MKIELYEDVLIGDRRYIAGDIIEVRAEDANRLLAAGLARPAPVTVAPDSIDQELDTCA
jgi:hypothetical protein